MKCEDCKYFEKPGSECLTNAELEEYPSQKARETFIEEVYEVGECHRFPASKAPEKDDYGYSHPEVFREDWCGEFEAKK